MKIKNFAMAAIAAVAMAGTCPALTLLHQMPLAEWKEHTQKLAKAGRLSELEREVKSWIDSTRQMKPAELAATADLPTVAMALDQQAVLSRLPSNALYTFAREKEGAEFLNEVFSHEDLLARLTGSGPIPNDLSGVLSMFARLRREHPTGNTTRTA